MYSVYCHWICWHVARGGMKFDHVAHTQGHAYLFILPQIRMQALSQSSQSIICIMFYKAQSKLQ